MLTPKTFKMFYLLKFRGFVLSTSLASEHTDQGEWAKANCFLKANLTEFNNIKIFFNVIILSSWKSVLLILKSPMGVWHTLSWTQLLPLFLLLMGMLLIPPSLGGRNLPREGNRIDSYIWTMKRKDWNGEDQTEKEIKGGAEEQSTGRDI